MMLVISTDVLGLVMQRMHDNVYNHHDVRPDWRCRRCVVMIIIMTVGDAEDAR